MSVFFDSSSEANIIFLIFIKKLGFIVQSTNIDTQKIDNIILKSYGIVVAIFLVIDWANKIKFFEKTFLVANVSLDIVFGILFLFLNDTNVDFSKREL